MDACMQALDYARENPLLLQVLEREKKLPLSRLALGAGVEKKRWNGTGTIWWPSCWPIPTAMRSSGGI